VEVGKLDHVELSQPREEHRGERDVDRTDHESEKDVAEGDAEDGYERHQEHGRKRGPVEVEAVMGQHQIVSDLGYHTKMDLAMHERVCQIVEICVLGDVKKGKISPVELRVIHRKPGVHEKCEQSDAVSARVMQNLPSIPAVTRPVERDRQRDIVVAHAEEFDRIFRPQAGFRFTSRVTRDTPYTGTARWVVSFALLLPAGVRRRHHAGLVSNFWEAG
jgi:hypothetical protein